MSVSNPTCPTGSSADGVHERDIHQREPQCTYRSKHLQKHFNSVVLIGQKFKCQKQEIKMLPKLAG